jgi:hypothetical protein
MIIETTNNELIIKDKNNSVSSVPKTPYFVTKHELFDGERIITYIQDCKITETFNDMIFNVEIDGRTVQTRPIFADSICQAIMSKDRSALERLIPIIESGSAPRSAMVSLLKIYGDRIKEVPTGFIIDDLFLVDMTGNANLINEKKFLCIVAPNTKDNNEVILSKILFLLNPNLGDEVFTRQLSNETLEILKRAQGIDTQKRGKKIGQ